ncbi:Myb-related protein A [Porphyridium purpureum]|uniref:Myb-related protein A n=1 Tax=Porphyridium purpureum TaxID=35688 RepID=A0A5J4YY30_PORPP|nr:Myb-related protein A [Porphyridium purpureum]|eukprot:POR8844..scf209_3
MAVRECMNERMVQQGIVRRAPERAMSDTSQETERAAEKSRRMKTALGSSGSARTDTPSSSLTPLAQVLELNDLDFNGRHYSTLPAGLGLGQSYGQGVNLQVGLAHLGSALSQSTGAEVPPQHPAYVRYHRSGDEVLEKDMIPERQFSALTATTAPSRHGSGMSWAPGTLERQGTNDSVRSVPSVPRHGSGLFGRGSDRSLFSSPLPLQQQTQHQLEPVPFLAPFSRQPTANLQMQLESAPTFSEPAAGTTSRRGSLSNSERRIPIEMLLNPVNSMSVADDAHSTGAERSNAPAGRLQRRMTEVCSSAERSPFNTEHGHEQADFSQTGKRFSHGGGRLRVDPAIFMEVSGPLHETGQRTVRQESSDRKLAPTSFEREASASASASENVSGRHAGESESVRRFWTKEEDEQLMQLIEKHGPRHWDYLASLMDTRSGQQVRLRYNNHLRFTEEQKHSKFTPAQDKLILEAGKSNVRKWTVLARQMGKSHNSIKNRYHVLLRRSTRLQKLQQELDALQGGSHHSSEPSDKPAP